MHPRIPTILYPLLEETTRLLETQLPGRIRGLYLVGSLALNGFNPRLSDVDFLAVLNGPLSEPDFALLYQMHRQIEPHYPKWKLEGVYVQPKDLGCSDRDISQYASYHDGKLARRSELPLSAVTWWELKHGGIPVLGEPPDALPFDASVDALLQSQIRNLNSYWLQWVQKPRRAMALLTNWGVQWGVLGVLRQYYTLREHEITTKTGAGEYALTCLPECWQPIIQEAIAIREQTGQSMYRSRIRRALEARAFLQYLIETCNTLYRTN